MYTCIYSKVFRIEKLAGCILSREMLPLGNKHPLHRDELSLLLLRILGPWNTIIQYYSNTITNTWALEYYYEYLGLGILGPWNTGRYYYYYYEYYYRLTWAGPPSSRRVIAITVAIVSTILIVIIIIIIIIAVHSYH